MTKISEITEKVGKQMHQCINADEDITSGRDWVLLKLDQVEHLLEKIRHEIKHHVTET